MDEKSINTRQLNRSGGGDVSMGGGNRNRWRESGSRNNKVSTESPSMPPSMLKHTKEADPIGPVATELQIHPVTASAVYSGAVFPIGSDTKTFKVFFQS